MSLDEASVESKHEQDRKWDSPHSWHRSNSDRQPSLTPRPLSPASSRGLDGFEMSHQPKDENQNSREKRSSMGSRDNTPLSSHESTRAPSRTSLQIIENTYVHEDPNLRRPSRSSSPAPSASKKRSASPTIPLVPIKQKTSSTPLNGNQYASPSPLMGVINTPSRFIPTPSRNNPFHDSSTKLTSTLRSEQKSQSIPSQHQAESSMDQKGRRQTAETDDLRDTDFSSRGGTPDLSDDESQKPKRVSWSSAKQTPSRFSIPSSVPLTIGQSISPRPSPDPTASSSTPPRRPSSGNSRHDFQTPSPPQTLPDLPRPPSSDESDSGSLQNHATTLRAEKAPKDSTWLRTPRPPGAWAQTPRPSRNPASDSESDNPSSKSVGKGKSNKSGDSGTSYPQTPMNRNDRPASSVLDTVGKTPRPPGGWLSTPAPIHSVIAETQIATGGISEQKIGLLTPTTSLSKGASFDPKTPGVPGGWLATPAVRKSILKVRFDPHNQIDKPSTQQNGFDTTTPSHTLARPSYQGEDPRLPPSPSSPRKSRGPNIRVVDAFGREQDSIEYQNSERNRSMLRVVDALGREVEQTEQSPAEDVTEIKYSSRGELLKHIRRGLDDLAEDFDDQIKDDAETDADRARIEELNNASKQARKARERLRSQNAQSDSSVNFAIEQRISKSLGTASWRSSRRFWITMVLVNLIFLVFIFRISEHWANQRYLNSYYDPFNPELYLYVSKSDHSLYLLDDDLSRTSWASYARTLFSGGRKTWYDWMRATREIQSYLWNIWTNDSTESPTPRNGSTWLPS
ncbi:hypothetical protein CVT25_012195 [Psilocybe cyanescens]|uniref:Uncharacterized protein n=1 Tax=Psilocybe cyanescens TaxID=93625 RepID=A0A409XFG6_PSICY|nr:hypothetical protein CVT25_012195 [Psilocybe cyanescens]